MTFRWLAGLAVVAGAVALVAGLGLLGEAPGSPREGRNLRAMKERERGPSEVTPLTIGDFLALPLHRPLDQVQALEARGVSMEGWVQRSMLAADGDMHLELTPTPRAPGGPDTAYVTAEVTPRWRTGRWSYESLSAVFRPNHGSPTPWPTGPRKVRITGWLLYDFQYDAPATSWGRRQLVPRGSGWGSQPVTRIEGWSDALGGWVEVPR